jgi:hypothetical protein
MSLLFIFRARNPWFARSALSSASTAFAHADLVALPDELLMVVLDGVDLADWVGRLVGVGWKLSVFVAVAFECLSAVGPLVDRVVRRQLG